MTYTPDRWVLIKFSTPDWNGYKVLAGWNGSYLEGRRWKLNSGITKVEEDNLFYYFHGYSGSVYRCDKFSYGFNSIMLDMITIFEEKCAYLQDIDIEAVLIKDLKETLGYINK
jgi:hypothetical protein